jgi:hypothetical protein
MGSTFGISAQGTVISVSPDPNWPDDAPVGGPVAFVEIAELLDITPPALTRNQIETTSQNEEDDRYIVGIRRHGELGFSLNFVPTNGTHDHSTGLQKKWFDGSRDIYKIVYPDGSEWLFSGYVTNFAPSAPVDDKLSADVTIRPTGKHDWAAPTP